MKLGFQLLCHWLFSTNNISSDALGRDKEVIHSVRYQWLVKASETEESAQIFHNSGVGEREAQKGYAIPDCNDTPGHVALCLFALVCFGKDARSFDTFFDSSPSIVDGTYGYIDMRQRTSKQPQEFDSRENTFHPRAISIDELHARDPRVTA
ncbi:hypothetical protein N7527_011435 [Penicillium freii]|nr:hypothetical protein N7527_011435 [Penicillium freii]